MSTAPKLGNSISKYNFSANLLSMPNLDRQVSILFRAVVMTFCALLALFETFRQTNSIFYEV